MSTTINLAFQEFSVYYYGVQWVGFGVNPVDGILEGVENMAADTLVETPPGMGRKKGERKTVMLRAYEDFVEKVKQASGERGLTSADFLDRFLTPCVEKAHRDYIKAEAKKLGGGD
jgi:hypothetical protein